MKCPLMHYQERNHNVFPCEVFEDCFEEECAWWDETVDRCSMVALSQTFIAIGNVLGKIADRKSINVQIAR